MPELYPDDAALLAATTDPLTGVEHIPTGRSPYHLEFRRLVQRLSLAAARANDLRVYQAGDLAVGVRPGQCVLGGQGRDFPGAAEVAVAPDAVTHLWLDQAGELQSGTAGLPADRTAFLPLAQVTAGPWTISGIVDLRGQALWAVPSLALLGISAAAGSINQALEGADSTVTAAALNALTGGAQSTADGLHRHLEVWQTVAGPAAFTLINASAHAAANVTLGFALPNRDDFQTLLRPDLAHGFLCQEHDGLTRQLVAVVHAQHRHPGALGASQSGQLAGVVPITGQVADVILSVGGNIESDQGADGVAALARVNGAALTSTHPALTAAAGAGFRSTARGQGTAGVVKTDGTQNVARGDVLTVDLTRTATGTITAEARDVVVLIVIRAAAPE